MILLNLEKKHDDWAKVAPVHGIQSCHVWVVDRHGATIARSANQQ